MLLARRLSSRPSGPGLCILLALGTPACGDSTTIDPTAGTSTSGASSTSDGSTGAPASTGEPPTPTSDGSADGTGTTGDPTTTNPLTTAPDTTTTTGTPDTTTTGDDTTSTSSTGGPPCGPGSPGPDADDDTVPDECDACPEGDDLVDGDADGAADACDPCPVDNPDDSDDDGVCEGDDICPDGDDSVDGDNDGIPDGCDDAVVIVFPKPIDDYDVAGDGAMVVVRAEAGNILATCFNPDRSIRRPEFVAGTYELVMNIVPPHPTIHIARDTQQVLVTWFDRNGGETNHRVAYSYLDDACQPISTTQTAIAVPMGYMEFHDAAIDALGHAVVAVSPSATYINRIDDTGAAAIQVEAFNINSQYGTHVAVNQATGDGIVAAQIHSGSGIHYRRFAPDGTFKDNAPVMMPVNYHYWYDGFTVGMNDLGEFVFLWRSDGTALDMRFHDPNGLKLADVQRLTIDFEGWDGGHCYDSFRRRHQEIPLRGDNFVLGEVYNWITMPQNRIVHHFEYTAKGSPLVEDMTDHNLDEGLTIRLDQVGFAYLRDAQGIHIRADYP